jgi:hypothetical protein
MKRHPPTTALVYDVLAVATGKTGRCRMALGDLCLITKRARRSVLLAVKRLVRAGLLKDLRAKHGRGWVYNFLLRAVLSCPKRLYNAVRAWINKFSTEKGATLPHTPSVEKTKDSLKTRRIRSPGHLMLLVRRVVNGNLSLTEPARRAIMNTLGRILFHDGRFPIFADAPKAIKAMLSRFERIEAPNVSLRKLYAWARWTTENILSENADGAGLRAVLHGFGLTSNDLILAYPKPDFSPQHGGVERSAFRVPDCSLPRIERIKEG